MGRRAGARPAEAAYSLTTPTNGSSRKAWFQRRYGNDTYELEAIQPSTLQEYVSRAIDSVVDVKAFNAEVDQERQEAARLEGLRRRLSGTIQEAIASE